MFARLKALDAYPKLNEEFKIKTIGGALISILSACFIFILMANEFTLYLNVDTVNHLTVDVSRSEKLSINFDITFHELPCTLLSVNAMDVSGNHQLDVTHHIKKKPLDRDGRPLGEEVTHTITRPPTPTPQSSIINNTVAEDVTKRPGYCGPCYGAELTATECCNTCEEVKQAYRNRGWAMPLLSTLEQCVAEGDTSDVAGVTELEQKHGCQIYGYLEVNRVAGNFHFIPGHTFQSQAFRFHDIGTGLQNYVFNVEHTINSLSFGASYPGLINPLDGAKKTILLPEAQANGGLFTYYVKVVPTTYQFLYGSSLQTNQFSVTEHFRSRARDPQSIPGVYFFYELSPIMVSFEETRIGLLHFVTQLCAIVGGVLTIAGIIDRLVYTSLRQIEKKMQMGKLS